MFTNYFRIALRNVRKNGLYSFLNITGLAIGLAACLLIVLYVTHELSYDKWNPLAERIVRPVADINFAGNQHNLAVVSSIVGPDAGREMPEVQAWCRFRDYGSYLVKRQGEAQQNIREERVLSTDSSFFEVFPLPVLAGDAIKALSRPNTLALSRSRAERYFASPQAAIGQTLILENKENWMVTAVYEDMPENSHFRADMLLSLCGSEEVKNDPPFWAANNNFHTYLLLHKGVDKAVFQQKFEALSKDKISVTAQQLLGTSLAEVEKSGQHVRYYLQNMPDIHLHSDLFPELAANGSIRYVWIFSAIAAFILMIACINFMNLATARSTGRSKEVGVRKALGGMRSALVTQFLSESFVVTALSFALAILMAAVAMPWYRELTGRELHMPWSEPAFWASVGGGTVLVSLLAGSYPAFFLAAFDAIKVLKGQVSGMGKGASLRSTLVVFQFSISVLLIISTMLVFRQLNYIQQKNLGFEKSQVIILEDAYALSNKIYTLKQEMLQHPAVESATVSGFLPVPSSRNDQTFGKSRAFDKDNMVSMQRWRVDSDYIRTLQMKVMKGRDFDPSRISDSTGIILNETAAKMMGPGDPVGQKLYVIDNDLQGAPKPEDFTELTIIGVVQDFHWASLRENIGPLCMQLKKSTGLAAFRYKGSETASVIRSLENQWKALSAGQPFSYRFLDDAFSRMYRAEQRMGAIAGIFGLLSIIISCLGLFGLAAYTTEQRRKEIGIRKVLGASVSNVTGLLAKDFIKLVLIAIVIASPVAWYFMQQWLADFAYRIDIQWWVFLLAGALAVAIAFLTVSYQSIRAALANPTKSLRSE